MYKHILILAYILSATCLLLVAQQPKLIIPEGHAQRIGGDIFSPDGKYLATCGSGDIKIWDAKLGVLLHTFNSTNKNIDFSPDGKLLVIFEYYATISIYKTGSWALLTKCENEAGGTIQDLKFSRDSKQIVAAATYANYPVDSNGKTWIQLVNDSLLVRTWNASDGKLLHSMKIFSSVYSAVAVSPDGTKVANVIKAPSPVSKSLFITEVHVTDIRTSVKVFSVQIPSKEKSPKLGVNFVASEFLEFSPDSKQILAGRGGEKAILLDARTGATLQEIGYPQSNKIINSASFAGTPDLVAVSTFADSADLVIFSTDIWKISDPGKPQVFKSFSNSPIINYALNKYLYHDTIFTLRNDQKIARLNSHTSAVLRSQFSSDGKSLLFISRDEVLRVMNTENGKLLFSRGGEEETHFDSWFTDDDKTIVSYCGKELVVIDRYSGDTKYKLSGHTDIIRENGFLFGRKVIITISADSTMRAWDRLNGSLISVMYYPHPSYGQRIYLDSNETKILMHSGYGCLSKWDIKTGKMIVYAENDGWRDLNSAGITHDWTKIVTVFSSDTVKLKDTNLVSTADSTDTLKKRSNYQRASSELRNEPIIYNDTLMKVWDIETGALIKNLGYGLKTFSYIFFPKETILISNDNQRVIYMAEEGGEIWDLETGILIKQIKGSHSDNREYKFILTVSGGTIYEYNMNSGELVLELDTKARFLYNTGFTDDHKKITGFTHDNIFFSRDIDTKKMEKETLLHGWPDDYSLTKNLYCTLDNNRLLFYDLLTGKYLYTFLAIDSADYLVFDSDERYDGTKNARDLLYFVCNDEVVELNQVKDLLWVPNLAERIIKKETIHAKTLNELEICGLIPEVSNASLNDREYRFRIRPRRGGLGETILYVNGIELKRFGKQQLKKIPGLYELLVNKSEIKKFFVPGEENHVSIKALTADNLISSRSEVIDEHADTLNRTPPNLYAVVVGVSDYKDDHLDLRYAAKDAQDIANALEAAAQKLLNTDGKQHVFIQRIHTGAGRDQFPEKKAIQQALSDIGKKSKPNDVLLVFFAGHGKMNEKTKQFHFLTAEATAGMDAYALPGASISSEELFEWMKPNNINVKKRILIFDACHSGQLNKDVVKVGSEGQGYMTARGDEQTEKIRAIEKMNEKSGLFILSASGSDQKAYEISGLEQGVLTYSLLHAIKEQPEILNDQKYLDLSRWFNAAERTVGEIMKKFKSSQQAQIVSTTNFEIGVVDDEVRGKIILPQEKLLFTSSEFRHTRLRYDTLQLRSLMDKELGRLAAGNNTIPLLFNTAHTGAGIYSIAGDYDITGTNIRVYIMVLKGGVPAGIQLTINGETGKMQELAAEITRQVLDRLQNSK